MMRIRLGLLLALALLLLYSPPARPAPSCSTTNFCGYPSWWDVDGDVASASCPTTYCSVLYSGKVAEDTTGDGERGTIPRNYSSKDGPIVAVLKYLYNSSAPYSGTWQPYNYLHMYIAWWYWLYPDHSFVDALWSWGGNKSCGCAFNWESGATGGTYNNPTIRPPTQPSIRNITYLYPPEYRYSFYGPSAQLGSGTPVVGCGWTGANMYYAVFYGKVQGFVLMGGGISEAPLGGNPGLATFWMSGAHYPGAGGSNKPPAKHQQLIVPVIGTFHTRAVGPYSLYFRYNASGASSYTYTLTVNPDAKPYAALNAGWKHYFNPFYGSGGLVGNVSYVRALDRNAASMTTANLTGTYRIYYKAEGIGEVWVEKGTRSGWLQLAYHSVGDLEVKYLDVELRNEPIRVRVRSAYRTTVTAYAAVAQPAPFYRFKGWWTGYAPLSSPGQWSWNRFTGDAVVTGTVGAGSIVGSLAVYEYEPNVLLQARIITPLPENSWVNDVVQLQGVVDSVNVYPLLPLNGSRAQGFVVDNSYAFTAPSRVTAAVRTLEGALNATVGSYSTYRWNRYFSGRYDVTASVVKVGTGWGDPEVDIYVCPAPDSSILRCSRIIAGLRRGSITLSNVSINGYIAIRNLGGSPGRVGVSIVKLSPTNFIFAHWEVNGRRVEGDTISGSRPSSTVGITACYAPEGYNYHPAMLSANRSIFLPGEGLPNPLLSRKWGASGLWMVNVTILYPDKVTDNNAKIHAMLTNGSEIVYVPFSWMKVNMSVDWSRVADSCEICNSSKCVVKWDASNLTIFPQVVNGSVPPLYKNWHLVALTAWNPEAVTSSAIDVSQLWTGNVTYAVYGLVFRHLGSGLEIRQPVVVSQLEIVSVAPSYRFGDYSPQLGRRTIMVSLNVTLAWRYRPPSGVNVTLDLPVEELGVSLESYKGEIGFWSYRVARLSESSVTYSLNLGDSLLFYKNTYPAGLENSTGSYMQPFQLWVRWQHSLDTAPSARLNRYQLLAPVNITLIPATTVSVAWEAESLSLDWRCFTSGSIGESLLGEAPWRADIIVEIEEWDLKEASRRLVKTLYFEGRMPGDRLNTGMSTSGKWVAVYLKPTSGVLSSYGKIYIVIPLPARYPPRL